MSIQTTERKTETIEPQEQNTETTLDGTDEPTPLPEKRKCSRCHLLKTEDEYISRSGGNNTKSCLRCRTPADRELSKQRARLWRQKQKIAGIKVDTRNSEERKAYMRANSARHRALKKARQSSNRSPVSV